MLNGLKQTQDQQSTLENYIITKETISQKRSSNQLSPSLEEANAKMANMSTEKGNHNATDTSGTARK